MCADRPPLRAVCVALAAGALLSAQCRADTIDIAAPEFWCPFACKAGSAREGFTIEILRAVFEPAGHRVVLHNENYSRALADVRAGVFLATPSTLHEEAPDFVFPAEAISRNRYCFYTRPGDGWRYTGPASLKGRKVGIVQGYAYGEAIDRVIASSQTGFEVLSGEDLTQRMVSMLTAKRIDTFVEEENLVSWLRYNQPTEQTAEAGCEAPLFGYVAFSPANPKSPAYAAQFSAGISALRSSGRLAQILARYGLRDWRTTTRP